MPIKLLLAIFGPPGFTIWLMYWIRWQGFVSEPVDIHSYFGALALTSLVWMLILLFWDANTQRAEWGLYYRLRHERAKRLLRRQASRQARSLKKAERKRREQSRKRNA